MPDAEHVSSTPAKPIPPFEGGWVVVYWHRDPTFPDGGLWVGSWHRCEHGAEGYAANKLRPTHTYRIPPPKEQEPDGCCIYHDGGGPPRHECGGDEPPHPDDAQGV